LGDGVPRGRGEAFGDLERPPGLFVPARRERRSRRPHPDARYGPVGGSASGPGRSGPDPWGDPARSAHLLPERPKASRRATSAHQGGTESRRETSGRIPARDVGRRHGTSARDTGRRRGIPAIGRRTSRQATAWRRERRIGDLRRRVRRRRRLLPQARPAPRGAARGAQGTGHVAQSRSGGHEQALRQPPSLGGAKSRRPPERGCRPPGAGPVRWTRPPKGVGAGTVDGTVRRGFHSVLRTCADSANGADSGTEQVRRSGQRSPAGAVSAPRRGGSRAGRHRCRSGGAGRCASPAP
jgi:hypothetical protein